MKVGVGVWNWCYLRRFGRKPLPPLLFVLYCYNLLFFSCLILVIVQMKLSILLGSCSISSKIFMENPKPLWLRSFYQHLKQIYCTGGIILVATIKISGFFSTSRKGIRDFGDFPVIQWSFHNHIFAHRIKEIYTNTQVLGSNYLHKILMNSGWNELHQPLLNRW